ncbi:PASTA domain-containing protein [Streptomyces sp. NPDC088400]|uniref:PASTA domain-containing protein n=1 Tax=Streptomyces sp. NPDC088400 TaxID=3365861 RepID=UPI00382684CA
MTPNDSRPSGCTSHTPFEEELVNAMNDFANSADAPDFDTAGIVRKTRRKRTTAIAGIAAALIVAGGGTALATAGTSGSDAPKPAAVSAASDGDAANVVLSGSKYKIEFGGLSLDFAKQLLLKTQLELGTVGEKPCGKEGKPGTVIAVDPHSPQIVSKGDTINLTLCAG